MRKLTFVFGWLLLCSYGLAAKPKPGEIPIKFPAVKTSARAGDWIASVNRKQDHLLIENRTTPGSDHGHFNRGIRSGGPGSLGMERRTGCGSIRSVPESPNCWRRPVPLRVAETPYRQQLTPGRSATEGIPMAGAATGSPALARASVDKACGFLLASTISVHDHTGGA